MTTPENLKADPQLRELLLTYFLDTLTGPELTDWLRQLGYDTRGSNEEKQQRVRTHTKYLTMSPIEFPAQTEHYLAPYSSELLADLCEDLGLSTEGTKNSRYRRIMREVRYREGWFARMEQPLVLSSLTAATIVPFLGWFPMPSGGNYEKDFYPVILDELCDVFGPVVYEQVAVAHGNTLKIDFHVGDLHGHGVGIEVKMPTNNADVQRAQGQLDQYKQRYGSELILFIISDLLEPKILDSFKAELTRKNINTVVR